MKKTLYLTRHGQTRFNELHKIQGASDSPLTTKGINQAVAAAAFYKNIELSHAYSSTQERAMDTLDLILKNSNHENIPVKYLKGLKEWDFGVFEGESETLNPKHPNEESYGEFFANHGYGGESAMTVQARMVETILDIMINETVENVLIVSHGGSIYRFASYFGLAEEWRSVASNLGLLILSFDDETKKFELISTKTLEEQSQQI